MIHAGPRDVRSLLIARRAPLAVLGETAAVVLLLDEFSKGLALYLLPELDATQSRFLQFGVLLKSDLAWGLSAGAENVAISAAVALLIVGLSLTVCAALATHDSSAPIMLGLIVGAGIANAADALKRPEGVVDWIAAAGIVMNLADLAVMAGLVLCARTVYRLAVARRAIVRDSGGCRAA